MNKKVACRQHAKRRAAQRFGLQLTTADLREIAGKIKRQEMDFVRRQSNRVTLWRGMLAEEPAIFVYDKSRGVVVTVLTEEMISDGKPAQTDQGLPGSFAAGDRRDEPGESSGTGYSY